MTFLPIVARELIEASRRRGTYWIRLGAAAAGLVIGGWIMLIPGMRTPRTLGISMFISLAIVAYVYCLLIGVFRTADCLSEEKREGTLGLLFLTDLKGYDIVLGKLVASSLNSVYGILALVPVMAIPLLAGGVTIDEFWRVVTVAMNTLFFSLAVGMFCSAISRDERRAMVLAFCVVLFFAGGLPLLAGICSEWRPTREIFKYVFIPSPGYAAVMAFEAMFKGVTKFNYFYESVICTHVMSWVLLVTSSLIVPRTWQDKAFSAEVLRRRERLHRLKQGSSEKRRTLRRRLLALNPFCWLVARNRMKAIAVWSFLAGGGIIWTLGLIFNPHDWKDEVAYILTALIAHTVLKFWIGTEACRRLSLDRQSGALELLLSTPIQVKEIARGQMMALERQFAGPVLVVLLADFIFLMAKRNDSTWVTMCIAAMVMLLADVLTLSWLGMWRGLNSRRPNRAAAAAMARVLLLPWIVWALTMTFLALSNAFSHLRPTGWEEKFPILLWAAIGLGFDALFGLPARQRLLTRFREVATQRFETRGQKRG